MGAVSRPLDPHPRAIGAASWSVSDTGEHSDPVTSGEK